MPPGGSASPSADPVLLLGVVPTPEEPLPMSELNFIMKALQSLVGEFATIELGHATDRPEVLRKWRTPPPLPWRLLDHP